MITRTYKKRLLALVCGALAAIGIGASMRIQMGGTGTVREPLVDSRGSDQGAQDARRASDVSEAVIDDSPFIATTSSPSSVPAIRQKPQTPHPKNGATSLAYIVGNASTSQVYMSFNAGQVLPVASMSKLITAIAATDSMSPTTTIEITPAETAVPPDGSGIHAGERFALEDILYPLLLDSSNIAAEAIASSTARRPFLELMSSYAWEIGMPTAFFADPSGLNPRNHASAVDMLALAHYLYGYRPDILELTRTISKNVSTTTEYGAHAFENIHPFAKEPGFLGGKTGRTLEAGETMMTILDIGGQPVAFIVLGSDYGKREADTRILIDEYAGRLKSAP